LASKNLKNKNVLITCGPTQVPIDDVRVISNQSTGQLGHFIAQRLQKAGAKVTLLEGAVRNPIKMKSIRVIGFTFYKELLNCIQRELKKKYDIMIHAAAVSDYQLKKTYPKKLSSGLAELNLQLVPTIKIIDRIKKWAPNIFLVGFKLEDGINRQSAEQITHRLFKQSRCDLVVVNTITGNTYHGFILNRRYKILAEANSRPSMSARLMRILEDNL